MLQRDFDGSSLIDRCSLAVDSLFPEVTERRAFSTRLVQFIATDEILQRVVHVNGNILNFESESFLPPEQAPGKPSLFFIVGNPTPASVARRAMYAYEGNGTRQHRFWKVMHSTGVLRFSDGDPDTYSPEEKMKLLFAGHYSSPFNFHVLPFFSLPSPPGGPWGGVAGLQRLFGKEFLALTQMELALLKDLLASCLRNGDSVLVSQKDAYMAIKSQAAPAYDEKVLRTSALTSRYEGIDVQLACIPPTRLLYSTATRSVLESLVEQATTRQLPTCLRVAESGVASIDSGSPAGREPAIRITPDGQQVEFDDGR